MNNLTKDYHIKSFISNYKKYFDVDLIKKNENEFYKKLDNVRKEILKIEDVGKNTLFLGNDQEIDKYVFLSCFSVLNRLVSSRYVNMMNIIDIWFKNNTSDNMKIEDEDVLYSEQDIKEDVLCVYVNKWMSMNKLTAVILNTVISSRNGRVNRKGEKLITWVYYNGSVGELKNSCLGEVYNMFSSDKHFYQIIDLSSKGLKVHNSINTSTSVNPLDDIY